MNWMTIIDPCMNYDSTPKFNTRVEIDAQGVKGWADFVCIEDEACWSGVFGNFTAQPGDKWRPYLDISQSAYYTDMYILAKELGLIDEEKVNKNQISEKYAKFASFVRDIVGDFYDIGFEAGKKAGFEEGFEEARFKYED